MMARGFRRVMELKRSMPKKPRMVANFRRNRKVVVGFRKSGGGRQSRSRKALRSSGVVGTALCMPRLTSATNLEVRQDLGHPLCRQSVKVSAHATNRRQQWCHG